VEEEDVTNQINAREVVLDMLMEVIDGDKFSHTILGNTLKDNQHLEKQERAFISRLFIGTVEVYLKLDYVINQFSTLPVHKMKPFIRNLLRMSVYQILLMNQIPESAICNEAVKIAKKRGFTKLSGFVNGILRNIIRNVNSIHYPDKQKDPTAYLEITYSFPKWLVILLLEQYDFATVEAMLAATMEDKTTTIRCNKKKITPDQLKEKISSEGVTIEVSEYLGYAFNIKDYDYLEKLDTFRQGYFTVQDVSSMLVCEMAGIEEQDFVVDVCAAPGGKALHAAETALSVSARDLTDYKINLIRENVNRMGFTNVKVKVWDALNVDEEIINKADVVIADLPCSGLGVVGKKSDIKYKLTHKQLKELAELQRNILDVVQQYVKPGGVLIYSTCTVNQEENKANRDWFLDNYQFQAESLDTLLPEQLKSEATKEGYLQLLQGTHHTDGFFLSKYRKIDKTDEKR
jgi:16S rRNA (cytosine967-C5)-methyltransferase